MQTRMFEIAEAVTTYKPVRLLSKMPEAKNSLEMYELISQCVEIEDQGHKERFYLGLFTTNLRFLGFTMLSEGGITGTYVDIRLLYQTALTGNAVSFIVWHNHPSGKLEPSREDIRLTEKIKKGAEALGLKFLDHLIISPEKGRYYSLADHLEC